MTEHIYTTIPGWFSFSQFYADMVKKVPDGGLMVELGTYYGCSFSCLVVEAMNSGKKLDIVGIDAAPEGWGVQENFNKHMAPLAGNFRVMFGGDSFDRAKEFADNSIDFLFIDANHTYEFVSKDIAMFLPKMKKGGIMAGHDYNFQHPGVLQAVDEAFGGKHNYDKEQDVWSIQL